MAASVPYDVIVVLVNSTIYGGGAICMDFCITTVDHAASEKVFVHELGHSMSYLADEYVGNVSYNNIYPEGIEPVEPNITRELDPKKIKWRAFLTEGVAIPTPVDKKINPELKIVGAFEGGGYLSKGMYRPEQKCLMGSTDHKVKFCVACDQGIRQMIDFYAPWP